MCELGGLTLSANMKEIYNTKKRNRARRRTIYLGTTKFSKRNHCVTTALFIVICLLNVLQWVEGFQQPMRLNINRRLGNSCQYSTKLRFAARKNERKGLFVLDLTGNDDILSGDKTSRELTCRKRVSELQSLKDGQAEAIALDDSAKSEMYSRAIQKTLLCVGAATAFGLGIFYKFGFEVSAEFFAGYLVEQSLSIDNLFVFLLLFDYFKVPLLLQDRVLSFGIYGAVVMRAGMIGLGAVALERFRGILLVFAGILVYASATTLGSFVFEQEEEEEDMGENAIVKFSKSLFSATDRFDGKNFFTVEDGIRKVTPLFLCLVAVEISDVVFAIDSVPAVFGVTENALIVFTSNMFAILGLRSLYTILSRAAKDLEYLEPAVALVLGFIGSKMVAEYFGTIISTPISLGVVATCLSAGVGVSLWKKKSDEEAGTDATYIDTPSDIN